MLVVTELGWLIPRRSCLGLVAPPSELYVHGRPCSPVGRVVSRCSLEAIVCELVSEVLGDVSQVVGV